MSVEEFLETAHYPGLISYALRRVLEARLEVYPRPAGEYRLAARRYANAVRALWLVLLPGLRPRLRVGSVEEADETLTEILARLERAGLLVRLRRLEVGEYAGAEP